LDTCMLNSPFALYSLKAILFVKKTLKTAIFNTTRV